MRPPDSASLSAASEIFITIGGLSSARAAPGGNAQAAAKMPAAAAARSKDLWVVKRMSFSPGAGLFVVALPALSARTLKDRRVADNGHSRAAAKRPSVVIPCGAQLGRELFGCERCSGTFPGGTNFIAIAR